MRIGQRLFALDQRQTSLFALPVVRPDVVVTHRGRFPLVVGAHRHRDVGAIGLDLVQCREELGFGRGHCNAQCGKGIGVVDKAVNDRGHWHTEGRRSIIRLPGRFRHRREIGHRGKAGQISQLAFAVKLQRSIKGAAGYKVARRTGIKLGVQHGIVFGRGRGGEDHLDTGVLRLEGGNYGVLPDGQVVVAPAFDGQRHVLGLCGPGQQCAGQKGDAKRSGGHGRLPVGGLCPLV